MQLPDLPPVMWRHPFTMAWLAWFAMFFFIEGVAVWSHYPRATLSSQIRDWLRIQDTWVIVAAWVLMLGLTAHFLLDLRE